MQVSKTTVYSILQIESLVLVATRTSAFSLSDMLHQVGRHDVRYFRPFTPGSMFSCTKTNIVTSFQDETKDRSNCCFKFMVQWNNNEGPQNIQTTNNRLRACLNRYSSITSRTNVRPLFSEEDVLVKSRTVRICSGLMMYVEVTEGSNNMKMQIARYVYLSTANGKPASEEN